MRSETGLRNGRKGISESEALKMGNDGISNMSQDEMNGLITYHFGEFENKFITLWIFWIIYTSAGMFIILGLTGSSIIIIIFANIMWLTPVILGLIFILKKLMKFGEEEKIIIQILKDDNKSKLITKDTWDKIPKRFLESKGLK